MRATPAERRPRRRVGGDRAFRGIVSLPNRQHLARVAERRMRDRA